MDVLGWVAVLVAVVALVALAAFAVSRGGDTEGEVEFGPIKFRVRGGATKPPLAAPPSALGRRLESTDGGVTVRATGNASADRVKAKNDVTVEAGRDTNSPKA